MNNDIITNYNGIEVYKNDIEILENDYISTLKNPDDINKTNVFSGLLNHIYINLFSNVVKNNTGLTNSSYDYNSLNDIFYKCYVPLAYKYNKTPTLQAFCCLVGISNSALTELMSGTYTTTGNRVNPNSCETAKKWKATCESALINKAYDDSSIGAIFGLKAAHSWSDQQVQRLEIVNNNTQATPEQIAEKYKDVRKPELIDTKEL